MGYSPWGRQELDIAEWLSTALRKAIQGLPRWLSGKESACNAGDTGDVGLIPGSGGSPGGKWHPTPVFLPGESHGQRSLVDYSPWGRKESDMTETTAHACN